MNYVIRKELFMYFDLRCAASSYHTCPYTILTYLWETDIRVCICLSHSSYVLFYDTIYICIMYHRSTYHVCIGMLHIHVGGAGLSAPCARTRRYDRYVPPSNCSSPPPRDASNGRTGPPGGGGSDVVRGHAALGVCVCVCVLMVVSPVEQ